MEKTAKSLLPISIQMPQHSHVASKEPPQTSNMETLLEPISHTVQ